MPAIIKPTSVAAAVRAEPTPDGGLLTVSAFLLSDFESPRQFLSEQALWPMVAEQMGEAIFDKGSLKPCGEWIIAGAALSPGEDPVTGLTVTVRLGAVEKRLSVFGDRFWRRTDRGVTLLPATPFHSMPIDDAHAFGGQAFKANPRGKGHDARALLEAGFDAPLPNVELSAHLIRQPDDSVVPARIGPMPPDAASRLRYTGTYDQAWLKTRAPLKPDDFNPLFYCDAPEDQRLAGYFTGSEAFSVTGMTRGGFAAGALPNAVMRCFVHRPADDSLTEIRMVCDTVTLFPNITKMSLAFRGLIRCDTSFADDIGSVMLAAEHADDVPRDAAYYGEIFRKRTHPDEGYKHALSDFQLMPKRDEAAVGERRKARLERARQDRERFIENQNWSMFKMAADQGLSPKLLRPFSVDDAGDEPLVATPTREEIEKGDFDLAEILDDLKKLNDHNQARVRKHIAEAELDRRWLETNIPEQFQPAILKKALADDEALGEFPGLTSGLDGQAPGHQLMTPPRLQPGEFEGFDSTDLDAQIAQLIELPRIDDEEKAERQFQEACARAFDPAATGPMAEARRTLEDMKAQSSLTPAGLGDLDSTDDFERQFQASIPDLDQLVAETAAPRSGLSDGLSNDFIPNDVTLPPLPGAQAIAGLLPNLDAVKNGGGLDDILAELMATVPRDEGASGATMRERHNAAVSSSLERLDGMQEDVEKEMRQARTASPAPLFPMEPLTETAARRFGDWIRTQMQAGISFAGADCAGANLHGADFSGADLRGTFFEQCDLREADFRQANLNGAVFAGARLDGAMFAGASLVGTNLGSTSLVKACLDGIRLTECRFIQMDLRGLQWRQGQLNKVTFIECNLEDADLSQCALTDVQIIKCRANRLNLSQAEVNTTTVIQTSLGKARLTDTAFARTSFIETQADGIDFSRARFSGSSFVGKSSIKSANFENVTAQSSSWMTADMTEVSMVRVDLDGCMINACTLTAADLRLARLRACRLEKTGLVGADLFGADLFGASLTGSDLTRASLRGANLYAGVLQDTILASCDLTGANLSGTAMERKAHGY